MRILVATKRSVFAAAVVGGICGVAHAAPLDLTRTFNDPTITVPDNFGYSVSISGDNVLIGAPLDKTNGASVGQAHLFSASTGTQLQTFNDPTISTGDQFGYSVSISGNNVLIGAPFDDTNGVNVGQAHLFSASTGALLKTFNDPAVTNSDYFGFSVAVSGDNVLIGSPLDNTNGAEAGQAHLFSASTGALLQTFNAPAVTSSDLFGYSVSISGDNVLIGAPYNDTSGANVGQAHLFSASTGALLQTFSDPTITSNDLFGFSVSVSDDNVLIGSPFDGQVNVGNAGQAYLFSAATGALLQTFDNPTISTVDQFGYSVSVSGDNVLIGSPLDGTNGANVGQAHLFSASTGGLSQTFNDPTVTIRDQFGLSVSVSDDNVLIGAPSDDTNGGPVGANTNVGQAHLFSPTSEQTSEDIPQLNAPGSHQVNTIDGRAINPALPTIVLTHGLQEGLDEGELPNGNALWTGFSSDADSRGAGALLYDQLGDIYNIVQFVWDDAFQGAGGLSADAYTTARTYVSDAGVALASVLLNELGTDYSQPIQFIGHSLGTAVNAFAASTFLGNASEVLDAQFTILDYPNHVDDIPRCDSQCEDRYGFDEYFFAALLQPLQVGDRNLTIDNYFALDGGTGAGVGDTVAGLAYNHLPPSGLEDPNDVGNLYFDDEARFGFQNNHSGVHQWYRWTIDPNGFESGVCDLDGTYNSPSVFVDSSLNPCRSGWYQSLFGPSSPPTGSSDLVEFETVPLSLLVDRRFGCIFGNNEVECTEASSPFIVFDIGLPFGSEFLSFDYTFFDAGDGDYLSVFLDDVSIWTISGSSSYGSGYIGTGLIPIPLGEYDSLTIALYGVGSPNASIGVRNVQVTAIGAFSGTAVPEPSAWVVLVALIGMLIAVRRLRDVNMDRDMI